MRRPRGFAKRLWAGHDAVRAAVTPGWSDGQSEGQINRLEATKRQMHGRAGLDPLGRRFPLATWSPKAAKAPHCLMSARA